MVADPADGTEAAPARAGTGRVLATMGAIAVVAVAAVVGTARVAGGGNSEAEAGVEETVPTTLAAGIEPASVPERISGQFDLPVVGAALLEELPPAVQDACSEAFSQVQWEAGEPPAPEYAVATPDGVYASVVGKGEPVEDFGFDAGGNPPEQYRTTCTAHEDRGSWGTESNGVEPVFDDGGDGGHFSGSGWSCCDANGLATATQSVDVPGGAAWAVQERPGWYLAYPVGETKRLTVTWTFRENRFGGGGPPQSGVTFLDEAGVVVGEAFVGGNI